MRHILAKSNAHVVEQFALSNVIAVFDYDGTLAPIVRDPALAIMRPRTRELLQALGKRYPCGVLSGRARADVLRLLGDVSVEWVLGNHGTEWGRQPSDGVEYEARVRRWAARVSRKLAGLAGVELENKRYSLAIHYRRSREKKLALAAIGDAVAGLIGAKVYPGKQVINVVPEGAPHKGLALQRLRQVAGCDTAIYVGDDSTDEDVFALDEPGQLLTVRVGPSRRTQAAYHLADQGEIDELLERLLQLRRKNGKAMLTA